ERVVAAIQGLQPNLEGARLRIRGGIDRPPMERSPGVIRLAQLAQRLANDVGFTLKEMSTGGASDGNFTAAMGVPTLDGLGPDGLASPLPEGRLLERYIVYWYCVKGSCPYLAVDQRQTPGSCGL